MKRISIKIPLSYRVCLFGTLAISWFSGFGFFLLDTFLQIDGEFGIEKHPWQNFALTLHGGAAFLMMVWFGGLIATHVPMGWKTKKLRFWGISLISVICIQICTAYGLYYLANETARTVIKWIHFGIGVFIPAVMTSHILTGVKARKKRQIRKTNFR